MAKPKPKIADSKPKKAVRLTTAVDTETADEVYEMSIYYDRTVSHIIRKLIERGLGDYDGT